VKKVEEKYNIGETYTITLHNGKTFTGVCAWHRDMDRYDRSTGTYGSSWQKVLKNDGHYVYVAPGPHHVPGEEPV
jgi:hypothetical protein